MNVLMVARPDLYTVPGGDTVHIVETARALKAVQVNADVVVSGRPDYSRYDLIHFFNIIDPEDILGHVYKSRLPYVVSPIYVDYREYDRQHRRDAIGRLSRLLPRDSVEYIKTLAKFITGQGWVSTPRFFLKGHRRSIRYILKRAAMLLPNSESEYQRLERDYSITQKYAVIPNAIDPVLFNGKDSSQQERNVVLCVGRIEGRKNQLNVIRALRETPYNVIFIGAASPNQKHYVEQCRREATPNMQFISHIPQQELLAWYGRARVHVLASWFETTGLSNLEAGAMGCRLVIGDRGDVRDYFKDYALYCEPGDPQSIRVAVEHAWNAPESPVISRYIFNNFTWRAAAEATAKAYKQVLHL